ncbi:MAG: DNA-directed RNA polymerase subunit omega [Ignavibacteria bacterium]|nr:DNA-directed RNA polymerase subunit omega [Ignavibacteria bacterium]
MPLKPIDLEKLEENASNIYEAIVVSAKRARQLNDEYKIEFNKRISEIPGITENDEQEEVDNPDQLRISKEFENYGKPTERALNELLSGQVKYRYKQ